MPRNKAKQFTTGHLALLKFLRGLITRTNIWLLRATGGRLGNSFLGVPVLLITTVGRKTGLERTQPLYYLALDGRILLVGSNAGTSGDPAWLKNIEAHPGVRVDIKGKVLRMKGRIADQEEKGLFWPLLTDMFPKWQMMEDRSSRSFKVVVLESDA